MQTPPPLSSFTAIKFWPTWIGVSLLSLLAFMPFALRMKVGEMLGMLTYWLAKERRYITTINIGLCFPELDTAQQNALVKKCFQENGIGLVETVTGWVRKPGDFEKQTTRIGFEALKAAHEEGKGILLIGAHYSTLDFGANLLSNFHTVGVTYRPHRNALFDAFMLRGRISNCDGVFDRNDLRGAFRHLKQGKTLWYAPDQDYGPKHAAFVPFFGQQAATITAASHFAAINNSKVFLLREHRVNRTRQYELEFIPFPESFPSGDDEVDATLTNQIIEKSIRQYPEQYLWMHKRFKTQPGGKPDSPYINIKTPNHRLTEKQYEQVLGTAQQVSELDDVHDYKLDSGLWLRQYPGLISKSFFLSHPAKTFDRKAKMLRMQGIKTITVDNFFRIPGKKVSAVSYFVPEGTLLSTLPANQLPLKRLIEFLALLHDKGVEINNPELDQFIASEDQIAISDPAQFIMKKSPVTLLNRRKAVINLVKNLNLDNDATGELFKWYAQAAGLEMAGTSNA